ncbi:uncharacterized protein LOC135209835 [Macrobrachium nipponense]|uniref:uncharacterized protein LOC135209835 n=1 Tax=Macrobrachium nipponense TaxID=159736 RepID=UPI0030C85838
MKKAAKELKEKVNITVRRADKTAPFVLIHTAEYHKNLDAILSDESKFERLTRNLRDDIKREANGVISAVNAATNPVHLPPIQGDYSLGYLYGNYSLQSLAEFLEAIKDTPGTEIIASLDVESLFTNVPVDETIDIILDRVNRNQSTAPLNIPKASLRTLLEICTKNAPFSTHHGQMFRQKDVMAMGSPLGVLFANSYMGTMEERVFTRMQQPHRYGRYIDDIFVQVDGEDEVEALRQAFQQCSELKYS